MNHKDHLINHVAVVMDGSSSMRRHERDVVKVIDAQIKRLAETSQRMKQETRVTIYMFADTASCLIYEMDVLRLPSVAEMYRAHGNTALIDAAILSQEDLALTPQKYGNHGFLTILATDGENNIHPELAPKLAALLAGQPENWTFAALVPDIMAKRVLQNFGVPRDNIAIWDPHDAAGMSEVGEVIAAAADTYMTMRSTGGTGTRTLFSTAPDAVNKATVAAAGLQPLAKGTYDLLTVPRIKPGEGTLNKDKKPVWELASYVTHNGLRFVIGRNYYRLAKQEIVAGDKELAVREKSTNKVFVGDGVRAMIGLSDTKQRVAPDRNPDYDIFVQSKSNNRHLFHGDEILVLK